MRSSCRTSRSLLRNRFFTVRRLTVKQLGVAEPLADGTAGRIAGLPRYAVGEEVVLFTLSEPPLLRATKKV